MTKALVTGGTGFIGSGLVKALLSDGFQVRVFDNNFRGKLDNLQDVINDIELCEGDIRDSAITDKAVAGCNHVYHLAFINGTEFFYKYPGLVMDVGIRGHFNIMDASKKHGIEKFIYASSSEVYQTPPTIPTPEEVPGIVPDVMNPRYSYGGSKLTGELLTFHYLEDASMTRIVFRPHNIYGPAMGFEHVIPQLIEKIFTASDSFKNDTADISIQGSGMETRAFCYIDDAINGILLAATKGKDRNVYHIGTDTETEIIELASLLGSSLGVMVNTSPGELQKGSTLRRCPDISKLRALGYSPKVSLKQGSNKTVHWYKNYFLNKEVSI